MTPTPPATTAYTVGDMIMSTSAIVDALDFAYFTTLTPDDWHQAKALARRAASVLARTPYAAYIRSCGPISKSGELIFERFLEESCCAAYDVNPTETEPYTPGFAVEGVTIDVHTRMLRTPGSMMNAWRFPAMVPELGLARSASIYVFCALSVESLHGYALGWATASDMAGLELVTEIPHPAKCLPISDTRPMHTLLRYIEG